ncbi:type II RES/Xre toxin-antitoxin system antitoxin [Rhodohalobacter sulfatireducens]|uniref:MbcA/ParS/Xre antitoxin family protein n=1 Tax=Rhodohalobacter sulfatireducens TaxID=2911366 RepID=A0ABS9KCZ4_9BACT|nr:antitoxin Xre/MbcA/ParS toxin-binding domain-containing protein [Rhodohalobacter sulfatireducens]MCG2588708.1 MbcA/ParS/Xre antitoxin family protein [Rhodohalobacter sulfatireducens]MDR9364123.1 DUF2384 domain-containing protein [Balneolaceae bacterium]MDR9407705.1 DUF2384 domain-containing protein [Balneolaceae bacterium]
MSIESIDNILREAAVSYETSSSMNLVELARLGISKKSLQKLAEIGGLSIKQFTELLPVSLRTIQRYSGGDLLPREVSDHALLIAEVFAKGAEVFDNRESFQRWLQSSLVGLGGQTPLSLLDTSFGIRMIMNELGRLEHGVYS